jgi:MFS transporter, SP family, general alpha glucoside:H+ symporter
MTQDADDNYEKDPTQGSVEHSEMTGSTGSSPEEPHPSELLEFTTLSRPAIPGVAPHEDYGAHMRSFETFLRPTHTNDALYNGLVAAIPGYRRMSIEARAAARAEHKMSLAEGLKLYPKAIGWSLLLSLTIIMEGYDTALITSFYAFPVFRRNYGTRIPNTKDYQIPPPWQSGLLGAALCGEILGLACNGLLTDRFGYRKTLLGALLWLSVCIFFAFFAFNIEMLLVSQILCGLSWGIFQTLTTTYAADVMPVALRGYLTSSVNLCWVIGQLIGQGVIRSLVHNNSKWSYRIPFGLQWAFILPISAGIWFAPESPWWLIRHGKFDEAKKVLLRLTSLDTGVSFNADEAVAMMKHTNEVEKFFNSGNTFLASFKGTDLRRTEIACVVWITQNLCGSALWGFAPYFYEQAGLPTSKAFDLSVGLYGAAIFANVLCWYWMSIAGRRTLYLIGLVLSLLVLVITGGVGCMHTSTGSSWALGSLIIVLAVIFDSTLGPVRILTSTSKHLS